jgi:hypothetical protein
MEDEADSPYLRFVNPLLNLYIQKYYLPFGQISGILPGEEIQEALVLL